MGTTAGTRQAGRSCGQARPAWRAPALSRAQNRVMRGNLWHWGPVDGVLVDGVGVAVLPQPETIRLVIAATANRAALRKG